MCLVRLVWRRVLLFFFFSHSYTFRTIINRSQFAYLVIGQTMC